MKYWLITGLKDNKFYNHIKSCINSFNKEFELVIVIPNGCDIKWKGAHLVRNNKLGVVSFYNKGLKYIKKNANPDDWFVRLDSDDYYGPNYLDHIDDVRLSGAKASGIKDVFIKTESKSLIFCKSKNSCNSGVLGGTLAGVISEAKLFRSNKQWGEDVNWCIDMSRAGINVYERSYKDFCLIRWPNHQHTFPLTGDELPYVWACDAFRQGKWSKNKINKLAKLDNKISIDVKKSISIAKKLQDQSLQDTP